MTSFWFIGQRVVGSFQRMPRNRQFAELCVVTKRDLNLYCVCAGKPPNQTEQAAFVVHAIATFGRRCTCVLPARCWYGCQYTAGATWRREHALAMRASCQRICSVQTGRRITIGFSLVRMHRLLAQRSQFDQQDRLQPRPYTMLYTSSPTYWWVLQNRTLCSGSPQHTRSWCTLSTLC